MTIKLTKLTRWQYLDYQDYYDRKTDDLVEEVYNELVEKFGEEEAEKRTPASAYYFSSAYELCVNETQDIQIYSARKCGVVALDHFIDVPCTCEESRTKIAVCLAKTRNDTGEYDRWYCEHPVGECPWKIKKES